MCRNLPLIVVSHKLELLGMSQERGDRRGPPIKKLLTATDREHLLYLRA